MADEPLFVSLCRWALPHRNRPMGDEPPFTCPRCGRPTVWPHRPDGLCDDCYAADDQPPFNSRPFCDGKWYANGYTHWCIKREGHDGACWCCDEIDGYPGGDLSVLETENADV